MIQGNDFTLIIPLEKTGERTITISKSVLKDLKGKEYTISTSVGSTTITASIGGDLLPAGKYGIELVGTLCEAKFRRFIPEAFAITVDGDDNFKLNESTGVPEVTTKGVIL